MKQPEEIVLSLAPILLDDSSRGLRVLILPDGNGRHGSGGDYAGGRHKVVEVAEHLAARGDVHSLYLCVLSPENLEKRPNDFFVALRDAFLGLRNAIRGTRVLVRAKVRIRVRGNLHSLACRGLEGAAALRALLSAAGASHFEGPPRLRLDLGVGYEPDVAVTEQVDVLFRSGMEEQGAVRLSGIEPPRGAILAGVTALWPAIQPGDLDPILARARGRLLPVFEDQVCPALLVEVVGELFRAGPLPRRLHLCAPPSEGGIGALEAALRAAGLAPIMCGTAVLRVPHPAGGPPLLCDVGAPARGPASARSEPSGLVLPGQLGVVQVPPLLRAGYANLFGCAAAPADIAAALRRAALFSMAHPALRGGPRAAAPASLVETVTCPTSLPREAHGTMSIDTWVERRLSWAQERELWVDTEPFRRAAENYVLTALGTMGISRRTGFRGTMPESEPLARLLAHYMLIVTAGDEGLFDTRRSEDNHEAHWLRARRTSESIVAGLSSGAGPTVSGEPVVTASLAAWRAIREEWRPRSHPAAMDAWLRGLARMYEALALEQAPELRDRLTFAPAARTSRGGRRHRPRPRCSPSTLVQRYLECTAASIGAGQLFHTAALAAPPAEVMPERLSALERACRALDVAVRLANDLAGWHDGQAGDRDLKETSVTLWFPAGDGDVGQGTAAAIAHCRRLAGQAQKAVAAEGARLLAVWPWMGRIFQRGSTIGARVYAQGHFTTFSREAMWSVVESVAQRCAASRVPAGESAAVISMPY